MGNKLPVLDEGQKGLNEMIRLLKEVQAEIVKTSQLMRETPKNTFDLKTPKQANKILQERAQITDQVSAALKEQDRLEKALISQIEKNKAATESTNRALIKQRVETTQLNRAIKEETILNSKITTEYQKLVVKMNQAGRSVQNLTAKKEQGIRLTKREQTELRRSEKDFKKYNRAVIKADASIKRFQRNVGNYSSGLGKAGFALRNFAGAFGLLSAAAIGREIFTLVKEIDGLDKALKQVTETQGAYNRAQRFTTNLAEEAGVEINGLQKSYVKFLASAKTTNLTIAETEDIFRQTAKAGAVLGLSSDDINGSFRALEQILSKGTVQAEEIRGQLGERLPGAFQILAKSMGLTTQELGKQLELGNVISEEVLPNFAKELEKTYGLESVNKVETLTAAQNRLGNAWTALIKGVEGGEGTLSNFFKGGISALSSFLKFLTPVNDAFKEQIKLINEEQLSLNTLVSRITDVNISNEDRAILIERLNSTYPVFNQYLIDEKSTNEDLSLALQEVNELYIKRIALQSQQENIEKLLIKAGDRALINAKRKIEFERELNKINIDNKLGLDLTNKTLEEKNDLVRAELELTALSIDVGKFTTRNREEKALVNLSQKYNTYNAGLRSSSKLTNDLAKETDLMKQIESELGITLDQLSKLFGVNSKELKKNIEGKAKARKETKETKELLEGTVAFYEKYLAQLKKEQSILATTSEEYQNFAKSINLVQDAINALTGDDLKDALDQLDLLNSDTEFKEAGEEIAEQLGEGIKTGLEGLSDSIGTPYEELFEEFNDLYEWDYLNFLEFSKKKIKQSDVESAAKRKALVDVINASSQILSKIGELNNVASERKIQQYDDEIQANNDFYAKKLDNENLSEEERSQLEAERGRKNAQLEKKKRDEKQKQAEADKQFAIFETIINTASAVVAALPNIPLSVLAGVLGAAQLAVITSQPIPKYKHGRTGGEAEFAYVGDGGVNEIIKRHGGGYEITPNRETLTYLNKGDSVLPDANKFLQEQAYNLSMSAQGRTIESIQVNNGLTKKDIDRQTQDLVKALSENKTSVRIHNNNSIASDLNFINRLNDVL